MPSIAELAIQQSCFPNVQALHGSQIIVLSGQDSGETFDYLQINGEQELSPLSDLYKDPRAAKRIEFDPLGPVPRFVIGDRFKRDNGQIWKVIELVSPSLGQQGDTIDFRVLEVTAKDS